MSPAAVTAVILILALTVAIVIAFLVACAAALLSRADGAGCPAALMRAGVAFAGTLTLIAALAGVVAGFVT